LASSGCLALHPFLAVRTGLLASSGWLIGLFAKQAGLLAEATDKEFSHALNIADSADSRQYGMT